MNASTTSIDMARLNNHPAFPVNAFAGDGKIPAIRPNSGMAIRDWLAGMAMQGLLAGVFKENYAPEALAKRAYEIATSMLVERETLEK
jgi:hypothetical protein